MAYIKVPMSSFPSFNVSGLGRGMTLHGKTDGRVGVDWGNSFHHEDNSWLPFLDLHLIFIMDTTGVAMHKLLFTYGKPHEKSCFLYLPTDFFECVEIIRPPAVLGLMLYFTFKMY